MSISASVGAWREASVSASSMVAALPQTVWPMPRTVSARSKAMMASSSTIRIVAVSLVRTRSRAKFSRSTASSGAIPSTMAASATGRSSRLTSR
ncbi:hypothetical protein D3C72_2251860 [compost metagenome]